MIIVRHNGRVFFEYVTPNRLIHFTPGYKPKETDLEKRRLEYCDDTSFDDEKFKAFLRDNTFEQVHDREYVINELAKDPHTCVMKETGDGRGQSILNCMGFGKRLSREDIEKLNNSELIDLWTNHLFYV